MFRRNRSTTNHGDGRQRTTSTNSSYLPPFDQGSGDGRSPISSSTYAKKCRDLMDLYRDLLELGSSFIFDFPRVVVIGGQSSGKSSLVEAVSGVNVPRDSGTCTRCPMICNMSSNATSWSCTIELCLDFSKDGQQRPEPTRQSFGPAIKDRSMVDLWIRRAQAAILSPHHPLSRFLNMSDADLRNNARTDPDILSFSKNSVQVNVYDPSTTDLSFVDLPGLIQNADGALIDMVRGLVESYVAGQNTLIVIAMPVNDDIEMIQGVVLAGNADPEKERTIGVMTKPDNLGKGDIGKRKQWEAILEGREHRTKLGYYCVRLPNDDERARRITSTEAQENAAKFFDSTAPWSQMQDRSRFGIPNFVANVSGLLVKLIEKNLKPLRAAVEQDLKKCSQDLANLPALSRLGPSAEIMLCVNGFCRDIVSAVRGEKYEYFSQRNKARYLRFKDDIIDTTPDFRPFEDANNPWSSSLVKSQTEARALPYVRNAIGKAVTWEFYGLVPFAATKNLVKEYTDMWAVPLSACFNDVFGHLKDLVQELIEIHFGRYAGLEKYVSAFIFEESSRCGADALKVLEKILALEREPYFTQNFELYRKEEASWLSNYKHENSKLHHDPPLTFSLHYTSTDNSAITIETPRTWSLDDELKVMASVQAYFQVAYKRIIDTVPLTIEHEINQAFSSGIETILLDTIFKDSESGRIDAEKLVVEDPVVERKRMDLIKRQARLVQIRQKLDNFSLDSQSHST